jgi:hypothetical protein
MTTSRSSRSVGAAGRGTTVAPTNRATVRDTAGLLALFRRVAGRRLVGAVDGFGCVELVFDDPDGQGGNLVTVFTEGGRAGIVALGFVAPELIDAGYCDGR